MTSTAPKLSFVAGLGVGYVLGARAGRERYRQIVAQADKIWHDPRVQQKAEEAQNLAKEAGSAAASTVAEKAGEAASKVATSAKETLHAVKHSDDESDDESGDGQGDGQGDEPDVTVIVAPAPYSNTHSL